MNVIRITVDNNGEENEADAEEEEQDKQLELRKLA